jgi:hypothetical protein
MTEQINIFVDNKPGRLSSITQILSENNVNIRAIVINDREQFGIIKVLADDPKKAYHALSSNGFACALKKVLAVVVDDNPGGLHSLTQYLCDCGINIIDSYGFVIDSRKEAVLCIEVKEYEETKKNLENKGYRILSSSELYEL